jgi:serine/threonine protein kinase
VGGEERGGGNGNGIDHENGTGNENTVGRMAGGGLLSYRGYETVSVLGKGSFGVVRLVRERGRAGRVYAMKVIRKSKMLRTSQEGHLRAERDILVASEGSRW